MATTRNHHPRFKFEGVEEVLDAIRDAEPFYEFVSGREAYLVADLHPVRAVTWIGTPGYLVAIPVENVMFMEGNQWNFGHAAALLEQIQDDTKRVLPVPAARVYRVDAKRIRYSQRYDRDGELSYQLGMTVPWEKSDRGQYYAQLLDGNHRAAAAILAGDPFIYVYVAENSRENVYKKDLE